MPFHISYNTETNTTNYQVKRLIIIKIQIINKKVLIATNIKKRYTKLG